MVEVKSRLETSWVYRMNVMFARDTKGLLLPSMNKNDQAFNIASDVSVT